MDVYFAFANKQFHYLFILMAVDSGVSCTMFSESS